LLVHPPDQAIAAQHGFRASFSPRGLLSSIPLWPQFWDHRTNGPGPNAPAENEEMPMQPHAVMPDAPERKNIAAAAMLFVFGL
jgi:hypothetical protein